MLATTQDPEGWKVTLTRERWEHIESAHPILARNVREIMAAVHTPACAQPGSDDTEVWFFAADAGSYPWIQVVVHYEGGSGWIRTAFPTKRLRRP
jgi:hypothetical protein